MKVFRVTDIISGGKKGDIWREHSTSSSETKSRETTV
jgi:hypothetical protein